MKSMGIVLFLAVCVAAGQVPQAGPPAAAATPASPDAARLETLVKQQFGATFTLSAKFSTLALAADFDGDGVEDVAVVANSKDPLPDSFAFKYEVADPYHAYFGMGNPRFTSGLD